MEARGVVVTYVQRRGLWGPRHEVRALDGATLRVVEGEVVGLTGRSGSGKSTLARCLAGLERPGAGEIRVSGRMGDVQLVMQDSLTAFEPRMKVKQILEEPFEVRGMTGDVRVILDKVGLAEDCLERRAAELSGGQRYRLLLGRALAARPKAMILDETFSALDDRARDQMTELVLGINLTLVLVSHDLTWLGRTCGRLAVMDGGRIVEDGETAKVLSEPAHPWTRRLVEAMRAVA